MHIAWHDRWNIHMSVFYTSAWQRAHCKCLGRTRPPQNEGGEWLNLLSVTLKTNQMVTVASWWLPRFCHSKPTDSKRATGSDGTMIGWKRRRCEDVKMNQTCSRSSHGVTAGFRLLWLHSVLLLPLRWTPSINHHLHHQGLCLMFVPLCDPLCGFSPSLIL